MLSLGVAKTAAQAEQALELTAGDLVRTDCAITTAPLDLGSDCGLAVRLVKDRATEYILTGSFEGAQAPAPAAVDVSANSSPPAVAAAVDITSTVPVRLCTCAAVAKYDVRATPP